MIDMGAKEQNIIKDCLRSGTKIPDRIENAPELIRGLELYLLSFFDIDSDRDCAFSMRPLSWASVRNYAILNKFDEEQTEDLHFFIRKMDEAHLKRVNKGVK